MRDRRLLWITAAVAALVVLFLFLRPGGEGAGVTTDTPAAGTTTSTSRTDRPTTPELEPTESDTVRATVVIRGGRPVGGLARVEAREGQTVIMFFRSDEEDEIHVHGYDIEEPVGPGDVARVVVNADRSGRFEIEMHHHERQVAQLTVTP